MKTKLTTLILTAVLSLVWSTAFADDYAATVTPSGCQVVTYYTTLKEAAEHATSGSTITVLQNLELSEQVEITKPVTLDLNGKTLIMASTDTVDKVISLTADAAGTVIKNGTLTKMNVHLNYKNFLNIACNATLTDLTVNSIANTICISGTEDIAVDMENCTVTKVNEVTTVYDAAITVGDNATLNVKSGTYTCSKASSAVFALTGSGTSQLNISGGTFDYSADGASLVKNSNSNKVVYTGGKFSSTPDASYYDNVNCYVNKIVEDSKTWYEIVKMSEVVATVVMSGSSDTTYYTTLQDAVTAAGGNTANVVSLFKDIAVTDSVTIDGAMTLNMNGYSITGDGCTALKVADGNVVIKNTAETASTIANTGAVTGDTPVIQIGCNDSEAAMKENIPGSATPALDIQSNIIVTSALSPVILFKGNDTRHTLTTTSTDNSGAVISQTGTGTNAYPAITGLNSESSLTHTAATTITLDEKSTVSSTNANAIYHPQRGTLTVNGTVTGLGGIEMKDGTLTLGATATVTATAKADEYKLLKKADSMQNVCTSSGFAVAMVKNPSFLPGSSHPFKYTCTEGATVTGAVGILEENWNNSDAARLASLTISPYEASRVVWADSSHPSSYNISLLYSTLQDAIDAAKSGETVTVQSDVTLDDIVTINKPLTINLNRKTLTLGATANEAGLVFSEAAAGSTVRNGNLVKNTHSTNQIMNFACNVTLSALTINTCGVGLYFDEGVVATMSNCNVTIPSDDADAEAGIFLKNATLNVNGSNGTYQSLKAGNEIFSIGNGSTLNIAEGYFEYTSANAALVSVLTNADKVVCTGGFYSSDLDASYYDTDNYFTKQVTKSDKDWYRIFSNNITITVKTTGDDKTFTKYSEFATYRETYPNALGIVAYDDSDALPSGFINIVSRRGASSGNFYCTNMELTDQKDFYFPLSTIIAESLTYTRDKTAGYNTVCLPFAITAEDVQAEENGLLVFKEVDKSNNKINFTAVDEVSADQMPCVVKCPDTMTKWEITKSNVSVYGNAYNSSTDNTYVGTFTEAELGTGYYKMNSAGTQFVMTTASSTIKPFRGYMYLGSSSSSKAFDILVDGTPTTINAIDADNDTLENVEAIYSLNGTQLRSMQKGVNIVRMADGKVSKVCVK